MGLQYVGLGALYNAYGTAQSLVPLYPVAIAAFGLCAFGSYALSLGALRRYWRANQTPSFDQDTPAEKRTGWWLIGATLLVYAGIFGVRFAFYCFHMTAGVV